jgi:hypothetical protein
VWEREELRLMGREGDGMRELYMFITGKYRMV